MLTILAAIVTFIGTCVGVWFKYLRKTPSAADKALVTQSKIADVAANPPSDNAADKRLSDGSA